MPHELSLFWDIVIIFVAAFAGSLVARLLRLPVIVGYLAAGMIIGPHVLEVIGNQETVESLAEFGVILLLFAVGVEVSFRDVVKLRNIAVFGTLAQIACMGAIGYGVGLLLDLDTASALTLALAISLSSTMVVLKTLNDRGDLLSLHGRILTGMLLVQDLAFVPMIAVLPALSGEGGFFTELAIGLLKAAAVLGGMALLGGRVITWLLHRVAQLGSREVFILTLVAISFSTAALTSVAGLSAALGAFVAGVLLSESDFGHRALAEITPLRDTFAAMFFVSLGMLTDPVHVVQDPVPVLAIVGAVLVGKFVVTAVIARVFGYLPYTAMLVGFGMVQIGEFSFLIAATALSLDIIGHDLFSLVIVSAVITMALTPGVLSGGAAALATLGPRYRALRPYRLGHPEFESRIHHMRGHAIVCGLGRVGSTVAEVLHEHRVPFIAIDLDPNLLRQWRDLGQTVLHGDSHNERVLEAASVRHARLLVVCVTDPVATWLTAHNALAMNAELDTVVLVRQREEGERLRRLGVGEVVWPELEGALEALRHSLYRYSADSNEVEDVVKQLRAELRFPRVEDADSDDQQSG
ncbi:MAG: cation:proton antiporter [Chloroflexota bacterium]|nr:cation:proton antiporter [Chloroflexota bacterium]